MAGAAVSTLGKASAQAGRFLGAAGALTSSGWSPLLVAGSRPVRRRRKGIRETDCASGNWQGLSFRT